MPVTEIAVIPIKPDARVGDPDADEAKIFKQSSDTICAQPGCQKMRFGTHHEDSNTLSMFIDWDTIEKHKEFMASETYGPFMTNIGPIIDGDRPFALFHVDFNNEEGMKKAFSAPVTEVATFYFDRAPADDYVEGAMKFGKLLADKKEPGFHGMAIGVTVEELERDGVKGRCGLLVIGWDSVQSHMDFRTTDTFKENIHLLRSTAKSIEMHHIAVMDVVS